MNIQSTKLELIRMIADIQNEHFFAQAENTSTQVLTLSQAETHLLMKINEGLSEKTQLRYNELLEKSVAENLTEKELEELQQLIPLVEAKSAERLTHLVKLADLWHTSLPDVMQRLDINPPLPRS
jgi:hypothetical protein